MSLLLPGHFLRVQAGGRQSASGDSGPHLLGNRLSRLGSRGKPFPEREVVENYERLLLAAVERRLRADVPVAAYLSGGVDSSTIVAMASKVLGRPIPTFTISVKAQGIE